MAFLKYIQVLILQAENGMAGKPGARRPARAWFNNLHVPPINKKKSYFVQPYALHGYKSLYAHPDLEYDITYCMVYGFLLGL